MTRWAAAARWRRSLGALGLLALLLGAPACAGRDRSRDGATAVPGTAVPVAPLAPGANGTAPATPATAPDIPPPEPAAVTYTDLGVMADSRASGYGYGYGPAIVDTGDRLTAFYCSSDGVAGWDQLRRVVSTDGGASWSAPETALRPTGVPESGTGDTATCDPSIVRWRSPSDDRDWWYLFYSGADPTYGTEVFAARAATLDGPFAKWTVRRTWEVDAPDPQPVLRATHAVDPSRWYGIGQQVVLVRDRQLELFVDDDTACADDPCHRFMFATTADPFAPDPAAATGWYLVPTDVPPGVGDVDVTFDARQHRYTMVWTAQPAGRDYEPDMYLARRASTDGIHWGPEQVVCDVACFPDFGTNAGVSRGPEGQELASSVVGYAAPWDLDPSVCEDHAWACWDLRAARLDVTPAPAATSAAPG